MTDAHYDRLEAALAYAARGWRVFPLRHGTKDGHYLRSWKEQATTEPETIHEWWMRWPDAEVAVVSGAESGLVIVDADVKNGGLEALDKLDVPETTRARTPSGGAHLYFEHPGERVKTLRHPYGPAPGLDVRGDGRGGSGVGGYVLAPPSTGYEWDREDGLAPLPVWVTQSSNGDHPAPSTSVRPTAGTGKRDRVMRAIIAALHTGDTPEEAVAKGDVLAAQIAPDREWIVSLDAVAEWAREKGIGDPLVRSLGDVLGRADAIIAEMFANEYGDRFRWCPELRRAFCWNGCVWEADDRDSTRLSQALTDYGFTLARQAGDPDNRRRMKELQDYSRRILASDAGFTSVLRFVKRHRAFCTAAEEFDTHPNLVSVRNGVLDLDREIEPGVALLREHRLEDMLTVELDLAYDPVAPWDRVEAAFHDWQPYPGAVDFLLRFLARGLVGKASVEALFAIGYTANAKSIVAELLRDVLGPFLWEADFSTFNRKIDNSGPRSDLVRMRGKRLGIVTEGEQGRKLDAAVFKKLTGGGEPIPVAEKHAPEFVLEPAATLFFHTNHMPELSGADGGVMRRVLVMPWDVRFYKADTEADLIELREQGSEPQIARDRDELLTELKSQREGFFAALVRAHFEEQRDGLSLPERVLEATREWAAAEDAVGTFLGLRTERAGDESYVVKDDLVREFNEWAREVGASTMDSTGLTVALKGLGYKDARRRNAAGERERRFVGIAWKGLS
jgi:putative DNA primase/helicase